jgi:hypothetical protein
LALRPLRCHALAPLREAIRATLAIFGQGAWYHSSPGIRLKTAQWAKILKELAV